MNVWLIASCVLLLCLAPCAVAVVRGTIADRIIGLQAGTLVAVLALLTIEEGLQRQSFFDLSLAMAVLAIPSTLLFGVFYRRWL
jgi:multisubunit Na+/H+ antiporter MnhF subunit